jgi:hypothetical protein
VREQLANRASDGLAHMWHLLQTVEATIPKDLVQPYLHRTDARRRAQVRADSIPVGALVLQQLGGLLKAPRHILIDPVHRRAPPAFISKHRSEAARFFSIERTRCEPVRAGPPPRSPGKPPPTVSISALFEVREAMSCGPRKGTAIAV